MAGKKIIAVVGATGAQGGGLVRAILADPAGPFTARALTRDAHSGQARELASHGVEVVEADFDDETSLRKAFDGAYGAYVVTNFWAHRTPEQERTRSRAQMELATVSTSQKAFPYCVRPRPTGSTPKVPGSMVAREPVGTVRA
jgi:nucleoside-diphosphate-sugar epimerase